MTAFAAIRPDDALKRFLYISLIVHLTFCVLGVMYAYFYSRSADWGGPGGSITVGIVGNVPAIPLPRPDVVSPSRVVDESKGLFKTEPATQPKPAPDATPIPKFEKNKPPKYVTRPSKLLENPTPPPENAIPYGGGGTPTVPTTSFALGAGTTQAGLGFTSTSGGDFGSRFSWYVEAVQRRISSNWLQSTVDPRVVTAPRVVVTFTILRNGSVTNIQVTHPSNNYSVDSSATRAVRDSSPLAPLPAEYSGSTVNVEFWFDFHR